MKAITRAAASLGILLAVYTTRCSLPTEERINIETTTSYRAFSKREDQQGEYYEPGFEITSQTPFPYHFLRAQTFNDQGLDLLAFGNILIYDHRCDGEIEGVFLGPLLENILPDQRLQEAAEKVLKIVKDDLGLRSYCTQPKAKKTFIRRGVPLAGQMSSSSQF